MDKISNQLNACELRCQFVFGNAVIDRVCRDWVAADMRDARLSQLFRAYYCMRSLLPLSVRQLLQRYRRVKTSPRWFFPDRFVDTLSEQIARLGDGFTAIHPWPDGANFAFVLSHDVESAEGARRAIAIANLEEEFGFRSSWNFVPHKYPIDHGLLRELSDRGFEIGVHGYNHDGRLFSSIATFNRRVPAINAALKAWGAVGFRAPMVHRNLEWLQALDIQYDASCFDADPYQAMPGGVGSVWPFIAGRFVELPYTLPQDHTLFVALNERDGRIWRDKLEYVAMLNGMSLVITHPDYLDSQLRVDAYRDLLMQARQMDGVWHALPKDVAAWWRDRNASSLQQTTSGSWNVEGPAAGRARPVAIRVSDARGGHHRDVHLFEDDGRSSRAAVEWNASPTVTNCESAVP